jgi:ribosomal protein S18 acetylase RimI-like enzyme
MKPASRTLRFVPLDPAWKSALKTFLEALEASGDDRGFKPHPFTDEVLERLAHHRGKDFYCVLVDGDRVLGYGMLRGWDEGYAVPSLGIAVHPAARRQGLGRLLMQHLHGRARKQGAVRVRLRVLQDNATAIALYREMGYRMESKEGPYLVGFLEL